MQLLSVSNLKKSYGERILFDGVSFGIQDGEAVGLIGANGTGKTTLFRLVSGQEQPDSGLIARRKDTTLGLMEQCVSTEGAETALDRVLELFAPLRRAEEELELIARRIEQGETDRELLLRQQRLTEKLEAEGGLTYRARARSALLGLGFSEQELSLPLSVLSGGQLSKISLARLLLSGAELLLLDEPTNHLDINAISWLEDYLRAFRGAVLVISHDRYFLDRVTSRTLELSNRHLTAYPVAYTEALAMKGKNAETAEKHYEQTLREIHRLEEVVRQQRQWNREKNIKTAESKLKVIEKLKETLEVPDTAEKTIRFALKAAIPCPLEVLSARNLSVTFQGIPLYRSVKFELRAEDRAFLLGANGTGKTTLLRQLCGQIHGQGSVSFGPGVKIGYFDQTQRSLTPQKTALSEVWDAYPRMTETAVRSALAAFLFCRDDVYKTISELSGGERVRIALLKLMLSGANLLLLDEPTNHLDTASREALEAALLDYGGTLLIVSHDRYFINKLATCVYTLSETGVNRAEGNYDDALSSIRPRQVSEPVKSAGTTKSDFLQKKQAAAEFRRLKSAVTRLESELQDTEAKVRQLETQLCESAADYQKVMELTESLNILHEQEAALYEQWEKACSELESKTEE